MTGTTRTSADLDVRRRRILFRAWHRGILEMDLVFGQFADTEIAALNEAELDELESLMAREDSDLIRWVTGEQAAPDDVDTLLFRRIAAYRPDFEAVGSTKNTDGRARP